MLAGPGGAHATTLVAEPHQGLPTMSDEKALKRFNGEDEDPGKSLKLWAKAKLLTFKDFKVEQRGPWLFTLLEGKALGRM